MRRLLVVVLLLACVGCGLSREARTGLNVGLDIGQILLGIAVMDPILIGHGAAGLGLTAAEAAMSAAPSTPSTSSDMLPPVPDAGR